MHSAKIAKMLIAKKCSHATLVVFYDAPVEVRRKNASFYANFVFFLIPIKLFKVYDFIKFLCLQTVKNDFSKFLPLRRKVK